MGVSTLALGSRGFWMVRESSPDGLQVVATGSPATAVASVERVDRSPYVPLTRGSHNPTVCRPSATMATGRGADPQALS